MNKREKLLIIVITVLVMINSTTLILMWMNRPPFPPHHPHHERPDKIIIERLQLDEEQQKEFEKMKNEHHSQMVSLDEKGKNLHKKYFALLKEDNLNDSITEYYELQIAELAKQREKYTFEHFKKLRDICRLDQREKFNGFIDELGRILSGPKGPPPGRN